MTSSLIGPGTGFFVTPTLVSGNYNTAQGYEALNANTTGSYNVAVGVSAGKALTTGNNNTIIGSIAGSAGMADTVIIAAGGTERLRIDSKGNPKFLSTGAVTMSVGTVVERPSAPEKGMFRYNSDENVFEGYGGEVPEWGLVGAGQQGPQGVQGPSGGAQGARGAQGFRGVQGSKGVKGNQGTKGYQGSRGNQGNQGTEGTGITISNKGSGRILTSDGFEGGVNAEAGLTFNGSQLVLKGSGDVLKVLDSGSSPVFYANSAGYTKTFSGDFSNKVATFIAFSVAKTAAVSAFFEYCVIETSNSRFRAGTLTVVWDAASGTVAITETSTQDLNGSTSGLSLSASIVSNNLILSANISSGTWSLKLGARLI